MTTTSPELSRRSLLTRGAVVASAQAMAAGLSAPAPAVAQAASSGMASPHSEPSPAAQPAPAVPAMRIVTVEEHFVFSDLLARIEPGVLDRNGWPVPGTPGFAAVVPPALADTGAGRLADMDASGVTMQVLSVPGPATELVPGADGVAMARAYNDRLAKVIAEQPKRFAGFAHLPMLTPSAAADELERAVREFDLKGALVNGTVGGKFLDHPDFEPVLARAESLGVPLYIHPSVPPQPVREAYYDGLPEPASFLLSIAGWGWHAETAVHILRLALSGCLDCHPGLKLLIGHMGEGLPVMMERVERVFSRFSHAHLQRNASRAILDQVWVSTSGFTSVPAFLAVLMTFGADRTLFSVDYPFGNNRSAVEFLLALPLSPTDRAKIAHGNADALLGLA